jgi:6-phosphogluconolactonase (cycloisomerase 2 family)
LVLRDNGGDDLPVSANGAFVFATPLADGATFSVSVSAQPSVATQNCVVMNAGHSGTVHGAGVTGVNIVCTPIGRFGYVVYTGSNNVAGFAINAASGALSAIPGTPFAIVADSLAVVPGAAFAYTSSMGFRIDAVTGALIELTGGGPNGTPVAVDPKGRFVYALSQGGVTGPCCPQLPGPGAVAAFGVNPDTGALTAVPGSPFVVGIGPQSFAFDPHGKFVYVANGGSIHLGSGSSSVSAFAIDPATGALTPVAGSPFPYGGAAEGNSVVIEPSGTFAYVAGGTSPYKIDPTTGALAPVVGAVAAAQSASPLVFDPSGTFAYAPCDPGTCGYRLDAATGALTPLAGSPLMGLGSPSLLTFEPSGKFLLGLCAADVCEFSLDPTSGALTPVPGGRLSTPGTSGPMSVAIAD